MQPAYHPAAPPNYQMHAPPHPRPHPTPPRPPPDLHELHRALYEQQQQILHLQALLQETLQPPAPIAEPPAADPPPKKEVLPPSFNAAASSFDLNAAIVQSVITAAAFTSTLSWRTVVEMICDWAVTGLSSPTSIEGSVVVANGTSLDVDVLADGSPQSIGAPELPH